MISPEPLSSRALNSAEIQALLPDSNPCWPGAAATDLRVVLGRASLPRGEEARLRAGMVIALDQACNAAVEIYAGSRLIALGELVNADGKFAVRIRELTAWA